MVFLHNKRHDFSCPANPGKHRGPQTALIIHQAYRRIPCINPTSYEIRSASPISARKISIRHRLPDYTFFTSVSYSESTSFPSGLYRFTGFSPLKLRLLTASFQFSGFSDLWCSPRWATKAKLPGAILPLTFYHTKHSLYIALQAKRPGKSRSFWGIFT